jgi:superfamily II DNA/RNA helicase
MAALNSFADLGLASFFVSRLAEREIVSPTEIQRRVIPRIFAGESVIFSSATGTGKTFAYLLPMLQLLLDSLDGGDNRQQIVILAPTYELCSQIKQEADFLLRGIGGDKTGPAVKVKTGLLIGSGTLGRQIDMLKKDKPRLLAGNPGRVLQLIHMGKLRPGRFRFLVLDEGDRLASEELCGETREIADLAGGAVRALCSATLPPKYRERFQILTGQAVREEIRDNEVLKNRIEHWAFFSEERRKIGLLRSFIVAVRPRKALIFTGRSAQVGNIVAQLQYHKIPALGIYGDKDKKERKRSIDEFRKRHSAVLVCSDLAARGLDIPDISHIIALDTSDDPDAYVHRAGRTARAGRRGIMAVIGNEEDLRNLSRTEKKLNITVYPKVLYKGQVCIPEPPPSENGSSGAPARGGI